jgi:TIGR03009 family protein
MTRLLSVCFAALVFAGLPSSSGGQTSPNAGAPSRYAVPKAGAPAAPQQGSVYGPQRANVQQQPTRQAAQPGNPYPVRVASGQQPGGPPAVPQAAAGPAPGLVAPALPQPPDWALKLTAAEQQWIDQVLGYWEERSNKVKTFECKFKRWDYEPIFGPKDANGKPKNEPKTYAEGYIKYAQPDKGAFRVEKLSAYVPPAKPGEQGTYAPQDPDFGEHWVCDGKVIYAFEAPKKQLTVQPLPPELQGKAIADGPLPFMFGARAETIKARYWIHEMPADVKAVLPEGGKGKYCLEAVPKARQDAQNFSKVRIILDGQDFLPEIMEVFAPNFDPVTNPNRQSYLFTDRATKDAETIADMVKRNLDPLKIFNTNFYEPKTPAGWKKVTLNNLPAGPAGPPAPANATRPNAGAQPGAPVTR